MPLGKLCSKYFRGWGDEQEFFWDGGMEEYTNILLITYLHMGKEGLITSGQCLWGTSAHFFSCLLSFLGELDQFLGGLDHDKSLS